MVILKEKKSFNNEHFHYSGKSNKSIQITGFYFSHKLELNVSNIFNCMLNVEKIWSAGAACLLFIIQGRKIHKLGYQKRKKKD